MIDRTLLISLGLVTDDELTELGDIVTDARDAVLRSVLGHRGVRQADAIVTEPGAPASSDAAPLEV